MILGEWPLVPYSDVFYRSCPLLLLKVFQIILYPAVRKLVLVCG